MKMPNRAVKMGGIFAVGAGLVAIALSVVLLVPNTTQAHDPDAPAPVVETAATPEPVNVAPQMASMASGNASPVMTDTISDSQRFCIGYEVQGKGSVTAAVVEPAGSDPVKTDNEFSDAGELCYEVSYQAVIEAQVSVWADGTD